jgi:hypothetical protein
MAGATTRDAPTSKLLYCEIKGLKATGFRSANGFLVQKGSEAVASERPSSEKWPWTRNLRQKLKDDGVLSVKGDRLLFTKDIEFASPSAAAAVIHGGHANGLTAWKGCQWTYGQGVGGRLTSGSSGRPSRCGFGPPLNRGVRRRVAATVTPNLSLNRTALRAAHQRGPLGVVC